MEGETPLYYNSVINLFTTGLVVALKTAPLASAISTPAKHSLVAMVVDTHPACSTSAKLGVAEFANFIAQRN